MKTVFLAALLLLSTYAATVAQNASRNDSTVSSSSRSAVTDNKFRFVPYTWDVSVDASFVLPRFVTFNSYGFNSYYYGSYTGSYLNGSPFNGFNQLGNFARFMARKNELLPDKTNALTRQGAYRLNVGLGVTTNWVKDDTIQIVNSSNNYYTASSTNYTAFALEAGYEWQQQLGRFQLFYGYDGFVRYERNATNGFRHYLDQSAGSSTQRREAIDWVVRGVSAGVAPLVGVKYFVHPRFSVSIENKFFLQYSSYREKGEYYAYINSGAARQGRTHGFSATLVPLSALNATFHFGTALR